MWQGRLSDRQRMHGSMQSQMRHRNSSLEGRSSGSASGICTGFAEVCYHRW